VIGAARIFPSYALRPPFAGSRRLLFFLPRSTKAPPRSS
jgi:hypothetical protein